MCLHIKEWNVYKPRNAQGHHQKLGQNLRRSQPANTSTGTSASRTVRQLIPVFKPPRLWCFVTASPGKERSELAGSLFYVPVSIVLVEDTDLFPRRVVTSVLPDYSFTLYRSQ